ncbi:MAG TPA: OmpP1/FadL family transporter [Kiritimatiellia bacterium]|nr:OmpP1/FadL family transporter [Kiritimatiellia bacterium]
MRHSARLFLLVGVVMGAVVSVQTASAAGFGLYEGSARANAQGGAVVARADDPSAIYYNPAGITQLSGLQIMAGATMIGPKTELTTMTPMGNVTTESEDNWWIPPHLYATYQLQDNIWLGFGMYSRFGLGTEFDEDWPGRYNSYNAVIKSLHFNPNIAVKATDKLSLAAGVSAVWFDLKLQRKLPYSETQDLDMTLEGDSIGYGFNLALRYEVLDWMALGASYQSRVKETVDGDVDIQIGSTGAEGDVELPDMLMLGVAFEPMEKLSLEVGAVYTGWSSYDELAVDFSNPMLLGPSAVSTKNWENTWRYCMGAEYELSDKLALRAGYVYDEEPSPNETVDYLVPANDRQILSIGAGYKIGDWTIDASYSYLMIADRHIHMRLEDGVLDTETGNGDAHMIGLSVSTKI